MIVSINQPAYLPWLGYFERIASSDLHIVLDHVQFEKNSMTNRNKLRTSQGWSWLTVPVSSSGKFGNMAISDVNIPLNTRWQKKHWNSIRSSYSKSEYFALHERFFESIYSREWEKLDLLIGEITNYLLQSIGIATPLMLSSEMAPLQSKSELVLELCLKAGADCYLSGAMGRDYLDLDAFRLNGIEVQFQEYRHPQYRQLHGEFLPYMSVIDLLFNEGPNSLKILTGDTPE